MDTAYNPFTLAGHGYVVTGTNSGIGRTVALHLLHAGATVIAVARNAEREPGGREWMLGRIPLRRLGAVEEAAGAVQFLLSDAAGYLTGTALLVDGGWEMAA